jgi:DnaK suppressor protein
MSQRTASHLSANDVDPLRLALERKRDALLHAQSASRAEQRGVGDAVIEDGDVAERMIEQEEALRLASFDATLLDEVERALAKIEAGTYGVSEESGEAIPLERLQVLPWARRTAEEEERR